MYSITVVVFTLEYLQMCVESWNDALRGTQIHIPNKYFKSHYNILPTFIISNTLLFFILVINKNNNNFKACITPCKN